MVGGRGGGFLKLVKKMVKNGIKPKGLFVSLLVDSLFEICSCFFRLVEGVGAVMPHFCLIIYIVFLGLVLRLCYFLFLFLFLSPVDCFDGLVSRH